MEHQEREERLLSISKLIRAKGHIRDFRNESLMPAIFSKVHAAFDDSMKLRDILKQVDSMESNKERETSQEKYKRYTLIHTKNHLIEKIEEAIKFLTTQCNVLNCKSDVVTVLEDLDRATKIFKMKMRKCTVDLSGKRSKKTQTTDGEMTEVNKATPGIDSAEKLTTKEKSAVKTAPDDDSEEKALTSEERSAVNKAPDEDSDEISTQSDEKSEVITAPEEDSAEKSTISEEQSAVIAAPDEDSTEKSTISDENLLVIEALDEDSTEKSTIADEQSVVNTTPDENSAELTTSMKSQW